ncbi:O-antigen ligase family protein [Conexibacter woesei]|uniref:O-antigen ligase family protein n=1 Tax=Conexibacter woesei TaxID=191495 RepID=UPI000400E20C|nr:O-antigen ligase family protein [Conexibacter woesei]
MLARRLRAAPITIPTLLAVAIFLAWIPLDGGQAITRWAPGGILVVALLALAVFGLPWSWRGLGAPVRIAALGLAAFTAWSFLSIAWADDQGIALEGADRTLLYLAVFLLFALWPQRPATAAWVLGLWTVGVGAIALITLIRVGTLADPTRLFDYDRLLRPVGYANAQPATWLMAFWPAVTLAATGRVPFWLRGLFAALAVVLMDTALLSLSRGALLSLPVVVLLLVALVPGRLRNIAALVPIAGAAALALPKVLDVGDAIDANPQGDVPAACAAVFHTILILAVAAGVVVAAVAAWETFRPPSERAAARIRTGWRGLVVAGAVVGVIGGLVVVGNPVHRVDHAWQSFKGGYSDNTGSSNRLTAGLGSSRYDFYRVALNVFAEHPIAGAGADNFFQDYLQHGTSTETPKYPHNFALRTLSQTGLIGTLLLFGALGAALVAAWRGMRAAGRDPLAAAVAGGATLGFFYWIAHGMSDWFWEWAGLGAPAFALLGLACALAPRADVREETAEAAASPRLARAPLLLAGGAAVLLLAAAVVLAGPWLAQRDVDAAAKVYTSRPFEAYSRLDRAARLNPLSDQPALIKGSIALRYGDLPRAQAAFQDALARNPRGQYATLELGGIASVQGDRATAQRLLDRASALAPRDENAREAARVARAGHVVNLVKLNQRLLESGEQLAG